MRTVILEIKNDRCKIVKILIFGSLSREHFQSVILEIKSDRCKFVKILIFRSLSQKHFQSDAFQTTSVVFNFQYDASYIL